MARRLGFSVEHPQVSSWQACISELVGIPSGAAEVLSGTGVTLYFTLIPSAGGTVH